MSDQHHATAQMHSDITPSSHSLKTACLANVCVKESLKLTNVKLFEFEDSHGFAGVTSDLGKKEQKLENHIEVIDYLFYLQQW